MLPADLPFGWQIGGGMFLMAVVVLGVIFQRIVSRGGHADPLPSDHADIRSLVERLEASEAQTRAEIAGAVRQLAERLDQIDRAAAQRAQSLHDLVARTIREKDVEDRRQFDRLMDAINAHLRRD